MLKGICLKAKERGISFDNTHTPYTNSHIHAAMLKRKGRIKCQGEKDVHVLEA